MRTNQERVWLGRPVGRRIQLAAITGGIAIIFGAVVLVAFGVLGSRGQTPLVTSSPTPESSPQRQGDVLGSTVAGSCVERYNPAALTNRGFAFDGTVTGIGQPSSVGNENVDPNVPVTFTVHRWFRGGNGDEITVAMFPPDATTSVDTTTYAVGSRLLVSGDDRWGKWSMEDPVAWACGFTRWYNEAEIQSWAQTFADE